MVKKVTKASLQERLDEFKSNSRKVVFLERMLERNGLMRKRTMNLLDSALRRYSMPRKTHIGSGGIGSKYMDDGDTPNAEPFEVCTYDGPRYPDDGDGPNATVYKQGHYIYSANGSWAHDGYYDTGKGCSD